MDDKKLLFIVNPRAGKTKSLAPLFDAAAIYSEAGYLVSVRKTAEKRRSSPNRSGRNSTSSSATAATARSTKR